MDNQIKVAIIGTDSSAAAWIASLSCVINTDDFIIVNPNELDVEDFQDGQNYKFIIIDESFSVEKSMEIGSFLSKITSPITCEIHNYIDKIEAIKVESIPLQRKGYYPFKNKDFYPNSRQQRRLHNKQNKKR